MAVNVLNTPKWS